jgi:methionyl-tRNA synthetase
VQKPWSLAEDPGQRAQLETVLYHAAESIRILVVLAHPALPTSTEKIWRQLGQSGALEEVRIDQLAWGALRPGTLIGEPAAVFPRVEKTETLEKIAAMEQEILKPPGTPATPSAPAAAPAAQPAAAAATPSPAPNAKIGIDDFSKVEMRVGQVKSAERVAGADKLLKVMVDVGDEVRQIVAGIATVYQPEQLVGRKVVVVVNLQPRKLRGVESNGMIVAASVGPEGKPVLAGFLEDVPIGSRLK